MDAGGKELQVGACGAGAAGSESQPYLEGAGSGDPAYRGRLGGTRCLRIGFGEDRGTRSLPGWALPEWLTLGRTVRHGPYRGGPCGIGPYWGGAGMGCSGAPGRETRPTG